MRHLVVFAIGALSWTAPVYADVRAEEKSQVKFEGTLGRVLNMFGGRAAKEGIVSTVAVKGNRKMTTSGDTAQLVDLAEEKVYDIDMRRKTYTVTTFAELQRRMEDARRKAAEQASREEEKPETGASGEPKKEVDVDFELKESGQRKAVNGFEAREVVMTITVREKGRTLQERGGLVMTSNTWLASQIANMKEIADFDRRYAEKLHGPTMLDAQQMAAAVAMYPMLQEAMKRFQVENVNMDGTPVLMTMRIEAVPNAEEAAREAKPDARPAGLGGLGGMLARKVLKKDDKPAAPGGRATFMTMQHEVLKVAPTVADAEIAIPAGFTERK